MLLASAHCSASCRSYRQHHRIFPYHLGHYICRVLRVSPFKYYSDLCYSSLAAELSFSELPNFTVSEMTLSRVHAAANPEPRKHSYQLAVRLTFRLQTWSA